MGAILMVATLALVGPVPQQVPQVGVAVEDRASVPGPALVLARRLTAEIYRRIPVEIVWRHRLPAVGGQGPLELTVIILSRPSPDHGVSRGEMGFAPMSPTGPGRVAYVFYDRVLALARLHKVEPAKMLSLAIAHELGHLLLPAGSHSSEGVMRGSWRHRDLRTVNRGVINLSPELGRMIVERLRSSTNER